MKLIFSDCPKDQAKEGRLRSGVLLHGNRKGSVLEKVVVKEGCVVFDQGFHCVRSHTTCEQPPKRWSLIRSFRCVHFTYYLWVVPQRVSLIRSFHCVHFTYYLSVVPQRVVFDQEFSLCSLHILPVSSSSKVDFFYQDPKHTKDKRECFLIGQNKSKRTNFRGSPLFQATYNIKKEKQTISWFSLCQLDARRLAEGKGHGTDWRDKEKGVT